MDVYEIIGTEQNITWWQMSIRAVIVFLFMVLLIRIGGKRAFAQWSAMDIVLSIIIGSVLSRAVTGNAPFFSTLIAGLVLVLLHRFVAVLAFKQSGVGTWVKGDFNCLIENGNINHNMMEQKQVTRHDLEEAVRLNGLQHIDDVKTAYLERNGKISIIPKENKE